MNLQYSELSNEKSKVVRGPILLKPKIFGDDRGFFYESWNKKDWCEILKSNHQKEAIFVQDNHSISYQIGTLRGLHYQVPPCAQAKLVRCGNGAIFDVVVEESGWNGYNGHHCWMGMSLHSTPGQELSNWQVQMNQSGTSVYRQ